MSVETDLLHELFRCDRYVHLFGDGMPKKACLRRQLERIPTNDEKGRPEAPADWVKKNPFCAESCELGRRHLEEARALKVPAETCLRCGSAQIGSGSAAPCAGCPPDESQVPRGALQPGRGGASERLWNGEVPDVAIGAPNPRQAARLDQERRHAAAREEAQRAREEPMAKGVPKEPRTCCDSKGGRHKADCTGKPKPERAEVRAPVRAAARRVARAKPDEELQMLSLEDLVDRRVAAAATVMAVEEELRRRQAAITEALAGG